MKVSYQNRRWEQGSVLLMVFGFAVICAVTLSSYLVLAGTEHREVIRSQAWNSSLAMAEAGVDEALAQMNASESNFSANDWSGPGGTDGTYSPDPPTRTLTDGSYTVKIVGGTPATIYSTGYVTVPGTSSQVSREVKVTAENQPLFNVGLGALTDINLNSRAMYTDSFNSTNGAYGTGPIYANGDVASEEGIVNIGNATINGNVYLGPDASFQANNGTVNGSIYYDYNVQFQPVPLPTTDANGNTISWRPAPTTGSGGNITNSFTSADNGGYYYVNNSDPIYVAPGVTVTLQVETTTFDPSTVTIDGGTANSGTLIMYQDAGTVTLGGNSSGGAIASQPKNFYYYGLPDVTSITLSGTADFVGAIYAPSAVLYLEGGGHSDNIIGSVIVKQATDNGHWDVHYDEDLATSGPTRGYIPTSWQEIASN